MGHRWRRKRPCWGSPATMSAGRPAQAAIARKPKRLRRPRTLRRARDCRLLPPPPRTGISPSAAAGKKIYDDMMCAGCHTIGGQGGEGGGALDDVGVRRTRAELLDRMIKRRAGTVMPTAATRHVRRKNQQSGGLLDDAERGRAAGRRQSPRRCALLALQDVRPATAPAKPMRMPNRMRRVTTAKEMAGYQADLHLPRQPQGKLGTLPGLPHYQPAAGDVCPLAARGGGRLLQRMPCGPPGKRGQRSKQGRPSLCAGSFLPGAAASRNGALAAQQLAEGIRAEFVLYLPRQHPGAVRPAGAPPGAGGADEVFGLS